MLASKWDDLFDPVGRPLDVARWRDLGISSRLANHLDNLASSGVLRIDTSSAELAAALRREPKCGPGTAAKLLALREGGLPAHVEIAVNVRFTLSAADHQRYEFWKSESCVGIQATAVRSLVVAALKHPPAADEAARLAAITTLTLNRASFGSAINPKIMPATKMRSAAGKTGSARHRKPLRLPKWAVIPPQQGHQLETVRQAHGGLSRDLTDYIERHAMRMHLSAENIAQEFQISRATLYRILKPVGGLQAFIWEVRLRAGSRSIDAGARNLSELSKQLGFATSSHFSRKFKALFGVSPSQYSATATSAKEDRKRTKDSPSRRAKPSRLRSS